VATADGSGWQFPGTRLDSDADTSGGQKRSSGGSEQGKGRPGIVPAGTPLGAVVDLTGAARPEGPRGRDETASSGGQTRRMDPDFRCYFGLHPSVRCRPGGKPFLRSGNLRLVARSRLKFLAAPNVRYA